MTTEWQIFTGDYEKTIQDIRLKDGTEYINSPMKRKPY